MNKNIYYNNIKGLLKSDIKLSLEEWQIQEIFKCKNDISYFLENYVKVVHQHRGKVPFKLYDFQKKFIKKIDENNRLLGLISRQAGKTVGISGYILHYVVFNKDKNVGIVANKGSTARKILKGIKNMYKTLPVWLQVGVEQWDATAITLGNGTQILTDNTSSDSFTGESIALLIVDEVSKIEKNLFMDFYDSAMPTISSSPSAKIIMFSTAKGLNHWHKLWTEAKNDLNGFYPFQVEWDEIPGRDEKWKAKIIKEFGVNHFLQEYDNQFLGSADSLLEMTFLQNMVHSIPLAEKMNSNFRIYEYPQKELNYYAICDYGEGLKQDSSTIQIFKRSENKFKQVAVYEDNTSKPREFATIKQTIGEYYNTALIIGESNSIGKESLNELFEILEYENCFFDLEERNYIGIRQTKKTKQIGNSYLKKMIENYSLEIVDYNTINQLSTYIKKGNSYEADSGCHDDLVMPLVIFSYLLNIDIFIEWYVENYDMRVNDLKLEEDDILPMFLNYEDEEDGWKVA